MYKALILDMDGTVMDTRRMVRDSLALLLAEYHILMTEEHLGEAFGLPADEFLASLGLREEIAVMARKWKEYGLRVIGSIALYPGVDAVLAAPVRRGIVTSQVREELDFNLRYLNIADRFEYSVCADELPYRKPRPEPLLRCLAGMNVGPRDALYVGDTVYDLRCARGAGVDFALAAWGAEDNMDSAGAAYIFARPEDMLSCMTRLPPPEAGEDKKQRRVSR